MSDDIEATDPGPGAAPPPPARTPPRPAPRPPRRGDSRGGARLLIGISVMAVLAMVAASAGIFFLFADGLGGDAGTVVDHSFLEVDLGAAYQDAPGEGGFVMDPSDFPPLLTEVTAAIRLAAKDENITGLYIELGGFGGGWSQAEELRAAVATFGEAGKPCYAYADAMENKDYYIASACKEIYLAPAGLLVVNGFEVTTEYYAGTLEKLGVQADFEHVGDFKTAVEPLQRSAPSDAAVIAMDSMLDSLYGQFVSKVAEGRGLSEDQVKALVDDPPITPQDALARGMVTALKYRDEVREGMAGEERTKLKAYRRQGSGLSFADKTIAVVYAEGQIISGESMDGLFGGRSMGDRSVIETLDDVREDDDVVAVVFRVNSPGGSGLASDNILRAVERLQAAGKPVVVSMGDYAASGGYYVSCGADWIVAEPNTLTGSIGVFGGKMNTSGLWEKLGVTTHTWQRGQLAGIFSPVRSFNDAERAKFRQFLEGFYQIFLSRVAEGRKMEVAQVHTVAQGRVWTGAQAKEHGLVDELGGLEVALAKAKELAHVGADEKVEIERLPKRRTFFDQLAEDLESQNSARVHIAEVEVVPGLREALADVEMLDAVLADGHGVAAMLPARIEVR